MGNGKVMGNPKRFEPTSGKLKLDFRLLMIVLQHATHRTLEFWLRCG